MAKIWTAAECEADDQRREADRLRILAERTPPTPLTSIEEAVAKFGPGKVDGTIVKLIAAGFTCFADHEGGEGWRMLGDRVAYVDCWGAAWGLPRGNELSWQEFNDHARRFGAASQQDVVNAAERARP